MWSVMWLNGNDNEWSILQSRRASNQNILAAVIGICCSIVASNKREDEWFLLKKLNISTDSQDNADESYHLLWVDLCCKLDWDHEEIHPLMENRTKRDES